MSAHDRKTHPVTAAPEPHYQNAVIVGLVLLLVGISIACTQLKVSTIMTAIAPQFNMSAEMSSWLMSLFTVMSIFFALPAGGSAQRFGFKKVMLVSSAAIIAAAFIALAANSSGSAATLLFSRAVEGIALTFISTCAPVAIQKCVDPRRAGLASGFWSCWGNAGAIVAAVLTPQLFANFGFEGVWIAFAAFAAVAAIVLFVVIREPETSISEQVEALPAQTRTPRYRDIFNRNTICHLVSFGVINIMMLALLGMLPTVLMLPEKGFDMSTAGLATTVPALIMLVSSPLFGSIAGKTGKLKQLYLLTLAVLGPGLFLMYTQTGALFWVGAFLLGAVGFGCLGLSITGWMSIIPHPDLVPKAMGVLTLTQGIGQFLGTFLVQLLLGANFENWFFAGAVLMIIGFAGTAVASPVRYHQ